AIGIGARVPVERRSRLVRAGKGRIWRHLDIGAERRDVRPPDKRPRTQGRKSRQAVGGHVGIHVRFHIPIGIVGVVVVVVGLHVSNGWTLIGYVVVIRLLGPAFTGPGEKS